MLKRFVAVIFFILVLITGAPMASATPLGDGGGDDYDFNGRTKRGAGDDIWVGLCVGASLDLSSASERKCQRKQQINAELERRRQSEPPDIGVGLCVGASLDLSRASAAKCQRQVHGSDPQEETQASSSPSSHPRKHEEEVVVTNETPAVQTFQYAALGDSVAAGVGLSGDIHTAPACGRTTEAYVYTVASGRGLTVRHFACQGATMRHLYKGQTASGPNMPAQLDSAFSAGTPQLVTITMGANDMQWDSFMARCFNESCAKSSDTHAARTYLEKLETRTTRALQEIEQRSGGSPPEVIITGYYNPFSDNCTTVDPRITAEEVAWVTTQIDALNQTLQTAAASVSFATFAPVDFTGHDICSSDPWIQSPDDPAPFHPTSQGQQAIGRAILFL